MACYASQILCSTIETLRLTSSVGGHFAIFLTSIRRLFHRPEMSVVLKAHVGQRGGGVDNTARVKRQEAPPDYTGISTMHGFVCAHED